VKEGDSRGFRERIIKLVMTTCWPRIAHTPELAKKYAKDIGLTPELLLEARRRLDGEKKRRHLEPVKGIKTNERTFPQLEIDMPEEVWNDWRDWCERQHAMPNAIMRGLLHGYLLGSWEPKWLSSHWRYKGKYTPTSFRLWEEANKAAWPFRERVLIPRGAKDALMLRAERINKSTRAIMRGLVLEVLEGRMRIVEPMDSRSMFNDPMRYLKHIEVKSVE
jgi:hypothetical protein